MCGGNNTVPCTAGQSIGCTGVGGCTGYQVCKSDGTYDTCICASEDGAVKDAPSDAPTDAPFDAPADAQTDSAAWTPANLTELQLWYAGNHINGDAGPITGWPDDSTHQSNLTPSGAPTFVASAINGQPGVSISGNDGLTGAMPAIGTTSYVAEIVARMATSTSTGTLWVMGGPVSDANHCNFLFFINPAAKAAPRYNCTSPDSATMAFDASQAHVFGIRRTSISQAQLRIDGTSAALTLTNAESVSSPTTFGLGTMDVVVAEAVLATNPSDNDVALLEAYLKTKYGL
jgi:hypothetical protein